MIASEPLNDRERKLLEDELSSLGLEDFEITEETWPWPAVVDHGHDRILALGNTPFQTLTGLSSIYDVTLYRGLWRKFNPEYAIEGLVLPSYHPSYVLKRPHALNKFREDLSNYVRIITEQPDTVIH